MTSFGDHSNKIANQSESKAGHHSPGGSPHPPAWAPHYAGDYFYNTGLFPVYFVDCNY